MSSKFFSFYFILFLSFVPLMAYPPPLPSAGVVERELEKEYEAKPLTPEREVPPIQIDIPEERLEIPDGQKVDIKEILFTGNERVSTRQLELIADNYFPRTLSLQDIYKLCQEIEQFYAKRGYFLVRAFPPAQEIKDGKLTIQIIEGKLGQIKVIGNRYYKTDFIEGYFKSLQGKTLQYDEFLNALMLVNDNNDLHVGALFEKGQEFGYADLLLRVVDGRPLHLYLNGNNYGRNLTTNARVGGRLDWGNVLAQGDTLSIAQVVGFPVDALYFTDVIYNIPVNKRGTSLEAAYLFSRFKVEELTSLHLKGRSDIATLKVNQAVRRTRTLSVDLFSYFDYKQIQNFVLSERTSFDKLRVLTVGALIDHSSNAKGRDYLSLSFAAGIPDFLGGLKAVDSECSRVGGGGRFYIFNIDYDRLQHLPRDCYFYFHGSGQLSPSKLTLPEQIYIGGADTVRGFPLAVALGDSGYYCNFELRVPPPGLANKNFFRLNKKWKEVVQFDAFLDHGGVFLQSAQNTFLWAVGVGMRITGPYNLSASIDVGFPLNHRDLTNSAFYYLKITGQPF